MSAIEIRGLAKVFPGGIRALEGIDFEVGDGELLVLVGPSASGKTTLLRLIAGLERPTAGTIRLSGQDLGGVPPHRRNVALVFQNLALYGHLTVANNLAFPLKSGERSTITKPRGERIREVAKLVGVEHLLDRYPAELSGGEQQRVALGRAIVRRPAALLLDEPLSNLDGPARRSLRQELKRLQRQIGLTTIYVTHDQAEALALGDRVAVLDKGRLLQVGTPDDVYGRPANRFVAEFFGPQGMNMISGKLASRGGSEGLVGGGVSVAAPAAFWPEGAATDETVLLGIRPENIDLLPTGSSEAVAAVGKAQISENVGFAIYLHVQLQAHPKLPAAGERERATVTVQVPPAMKQRIPRVDETVHLRFQYDALHWFAATGSRLDNRGLTANP